MCLSGAHCVSLREVLWAGNVYLHVVHPESEAQRNEDTRPTYRSRVYFNHFSAASCCTVTSQCRLSYHVRKYEGIIYVGCTQFFLKQKHGVFPVVNESSIIPPKTSLGFPPVVICPYSPGVLSFTPLFQG